MARILIVDDEASVRLMLEESFNIAGFTTLTAGNGVEAVELFRAQAPDVVVTDILMPEKEGLQLIKELLREQPNLKIIAISGGAHMLSSGCNLELAKMFGASRVFQKPLDIDALIETIKGMLE